METQELDIPVLWPNYIEDCAQCSERLINSLKDLDGMHSVKLDPNRRTLNITYDKELLTFEEIREHARVLGVTIEDKYKHEMLRLSGLDCPDCAMKLEKAIKRMNGVAWASLSYATSVMIVEYEPAKIDLNNIIKKIKDLGYIVDRRTIPTAAEAPEEKKLRNIRLILTSTSGALLLAAVLCDVADLQIPSTILALLSAISGGIFIVRTGILSLKSLQLDTNFLMTIAAAGAIVIGEYIEAAAVMFLFSLGYTLEAYTVDKTRRSIKSLISAFPTHATVKRNGSLTKVPLEEIEIGDVVVIKPGDKIPIDGTVLSGESTVNEAPITGESLPKEKYPGDTVYSGSINGSGSLDIRATSTFQDNTISRIIQLVEEAQSQKAPSQKFSETFGRYYTPCVIVLALLIALIGPAFSSQPNIEWIKKALVLLVVSCPCALVISTPVAIVAAIGNAAKSGILIKGGAHLETLGKITLVAFDKTGTLTEGKLSVSEVVSFSAHSKEDILRVAAAVESRSEHPLADAIIKKARELQLEEMPVSFFQAIPGMGALAVVDGNAYYVGNKRLLENYSIPIPESKIIDELLSAGNSIVYVCDETEAWGIICARDTLKPGSAGAIAELKKIGIKKAIMLTGDNKRTASAIVNDLSLDDVYSELLPEEKLALIKDFAAQGEYVAMVGDGINDAPALAAAHVGISMGALGSQAAIEASDIALMADDIVMLPYGVSLSKRANRIIKQNIAFALSVVFLLVVGALFKWINLAIGVLGHEGSAMLVILNSMRLLKK